MNKLGVHALVPGRQPREIRIRAAIQHALKHPLAIGDGFLEARQRQAPARVVRHGSRVVERVGVRQNRRRPPLPQTPELLKPAHVAELPARRVDDREQRAEFPFAVQVVGHGARVRSGLLQFAAQIHAPESK